MKVVKKNVYYCDFCKKRKLRKDAMISHELHCTKNLDRKCQMCDNLGQLPPDYREIIKELETYYVIHESQDDYGMLANITSYSIQWVKEEITTKTLLDLASGCPACMLTIHIHLHYLAKPKDFDYKKEVDAFWAEINSLKAEEIPYY